MDWKITDGTFKGFKFHVATPKNVNFGMTSQEVTDERRLQVSERALVNGGDVEDFGAKPRPLSAEVIFFGEDYQTQLKEFMRVLNEGTTGVLILPDLDEAVRAKFQKSVRRTSTDTSTVLSVSWIEDRSEVINATDAASAIQAQAALQGGNPAQAIPTIQEQAAKATAKANSALDKLNNNSFVKALQEAEKSVTNTRVAINSALNIPRVARQNIISTVGRINGEINGLKSAINGLLNFSDLLVIGLSFTNPTRVNSGLGRVDFAEVEAPVTTQVVGNSQVVTTPQDNKEYGSFKEASQEISQIADTLAELDTELEESTGGNTEDFSAESVALLNTVKDLLFILEERPTAQVFSSINQSLMEICHNNGLPVDDMERVYRLNTNIQDPLDIPAFTVINI